MLHAPYNPSNHTTLIWYFLFHYHFSVSCNFWFYFIINFFIIYSKVGHGQTYPSLYPRGGRVRVSVRYTIVKIQFHKPTIEICMAVYVLESIAFHPSWTSKMWELNTECQQNSSFSLCSIFLALCLCKK